MGNGMERIKVMLQRIEENIMRRINSIEEKIEVLMKRMEPQWVVKREGIDPEQSDSPDANRFREMLQKASEEMDEKMREINDTENNSEKERRQETIAEKGQQGITITQDDKEERVDHKVRMEDSHNENEEEEKSSDDGGESSEEEERSIKGGNSKQNDKTMGEEMDEEMHEDEYCDSYDDTSDEEEQQRKKDGDQGNEMWDPDQELDNGWEVHSQKRWEKTQDI